MKHYEIMSEIKDYNDFYAFSVMKTMICEKAEKHITYAMLTKQI